MKTICTAIALLMMCCWCLGKASPPPATSGFDPDRHMRVSEVRPGMKGYGLSVFNGATIERFDVEVLSVLKNFNPKHDVVLIKCRGANLQHTGTIAGMSGSPIYLTDSQGKSRMIGALAYGWPLMKDPVAGVQPIEYMLQMVRKAAPVGINPNPDKPSPVPLTASPAPWSLWDCLPMPWEKTSPAVYPLAGWNAFSPNPRSSTGQEDTTRLQPLATPLMTAGMPPKLLEQFAPLFRSRGLVPLQAGGGGSNAADNAAKLEPGSVLALPLISGDLDMSAIGTCTEVLGDQVFGFGHPFNNEGSVSLPMGSGQISAVIANLSTSFKIGSLTKIHGTLSSDQMVGVAGCIGQAPPTAPIDLHVLYTDGSLDQTYHFNSTLHPKLTPLIGFAAFSAAVAGVRDLPQYHTLEYDVEMAFANGQSVHMVNTCVNADPAELFFELGGSMVAAAENPFERVLLKKMSGTVRVIPEAKVAQILSVDVPKDKYHPGETLKAYVRYRPFRCSESILPVVLDLPRDLADGKYQLVICDWQKFLEDEQAARPFRFTAQNIDEVFAVLRDLTSLRRNALYLRLVREADGVAVGRTAMPYLPGSRRQVMLGAGRSNTTAFVSSTVKSVPAPVVMNGSADFVITIDKDAKVEAGGQRPPKHEVREITPPASKGGEPKARG